jgi:phosphoglycerol transferase MdoB-like AlkP superfamily enzyme
LTDDLTLNCNSDNDSDGFLLREDCDDASSLVFPGAPEISGNYRDEDCDGVDNPQRNVIWIFLESFGLENISQTRTPFLYSLMHEQNNWPRFYSNGVDTASSLVSSLCSLLPQQGWTDLLDPVFEKNLCLPEVLRQRGFATVEIQAGDLDFLSKKEFFKNIGFDTILGADEMKNVVAGSWGASDAELYHYVATTLAQTPQPFFATVYTLAVHHPYNVPPDGQVLYPHDTFPHKVFNLMAYADRSLEQFWKLNQKEAWFQNSIIMLTADNGQPLDDRGSNFLSYAGAYQANIAIPLVMIDPQQPGARTHTAIGSHIDLAPTTLGLLGIDATNAFQGQSLFEKNNADPLFAIASALGRCQAAYRSGDQKLIRKWGSEYTELYDLANDPREINNISADQAEYTFQQGKKMDAIILNQQALFLQKRIWPAFIN